MERFLFLNCIHLTEKRRNAFLKYCLMKILLNHDTIILFCSCYHHVTLFVIKKLHVYKRKLYKCWIIEHKNRQAGFQKNICFVVKKT